MIDIVLCASGRDEVRIVHDVARGPGSGARIVRRCADLAETTAVAAAGIGDVVVIDLGVRGLDRDAAADLLRAGTAVVGLRSEEGAATRTSLGLRTVVDASASLPELLEACERAIGGEGASGAEEPWVQDAGEGDEADEHRVPPAPLLAVWGPGGAPGRSTVAANLAAELADAGTGTVLVDADTHNPALSQMLGVLDESPGLVAACRAAARDTLDADTLDALLPSARGRLHLLSGIGVPARWAEVHRASLDDVWTGLRGRGGIVVADVGAPLEEDEELSYDTAAPQRNAAALSALSRADTVIAVVSADPISITRLARERDRLGELGVGEMHVVVNRVGPPANAARVTELIRGRLPAASVTCLPEDSSVCRRAAWDGALLAETAPRSALRRALRDLAAALRPPEDTGGGVTSEPARESAMAG
ncbi:pilus assembly protein CpaE [Brachybacterium endophyticum]|uniref:Pilus assembly protein CpaE n=1 Tax=Brachybacterium endophyticum TaxID=2182385 RepID=A0A2U2RH41_9MICO|nr:P-loop NTPase [Brachybacterium endophyticum]PWH05168.1 pilus assembly protein CpaE [Brachybacterium endophyticum]